MILPRLLSESPLSQKAAAGTPLSRCVVAAAKLKDEVEA
jgi:hypothetical protein